MGNIDAGRIKNQINIIFYLIFYADVFYGLGWMAAKLAGEEKELYRDIRTVISIIGKYTKTLQWVCMILIMVVFVGTADKNTFSTISAVRSLTKGEAQTYYMEAEERLQDYKNPAISTVEAAPFSVKPHVLYFTDIVEKNDPNYWINENIADFYGKKEVILKVENN